MKQDEAWVPSKLTVIDDCNYVELHTRNKHLAPMCSLRGAAKNKSPWADNGFLNQLRDLRNKAVDELLLALLREKDPFATYAELPKDFQRTKADASDIAPTVTVSLPYIEVDGESADAMDIKLLTELIPGRVVAIEMTSAALSYVRLACIAVSKKRVPSPSAGHAHEATTARVRRLCDHELEAHHP